MGIAVLTAVFLGNGGTITPSGYDESIGPALLTGPTAPLVVRPLVIGASGCKNRVLSSTGPAIRWAYHLRGDDQAPEWDMHTVDRKGANAWRSRSAGVAAGSREGGDQRDQDGCSAGHWPTSIRDQRAASGTPRAPLSVSRASSAARASSS